MIATGGGLMSVPEKVASSSPASLAMAVLESQAVRTRKFSFVRING